MIMGPRTNKDCPICGKTFSRSSVTRKHIQKVHKVPCESKAPSIKCPVADCSSTYRAVKEYRIHLQNDHLLSLEFEELSFDGKEEFLFWLKREENSTGSRYVRKCVNAKLNGITKSYYYCNRSGTYQDTCVTTGRKRKLKSQGSCKAGFHCTSTLETTEKETGRISVHYCKTHYGHDTRLGHVQLTKEERSNIAGKLALGVSHRKILNDIRQSAENKNKIQRQHIITKKDLHNISHSFRISKEKIPDMKNVSFDAWVEEARRGDSGNAVLFHKQIGEEYPGLAMQDFVLVLMFPFQKYMLQKLGKDRVCLDSTYGVNSAGFELTSVLVVDKYEEGVPAAFCVSSSVNTEILEICFSAIKDRVGIIKCKILMSDADPMFVNAWSSSMCAPDHHLLCTWHVDRAWLGQLDTITDLDKRAEVYKTLKVCQLELCEEKFLKTFQEFMVRLQDDNETKPFYEFMNKYYEHRVHKWAYCFRLGLKMNTNMHIQNLHKNVKYGYLMGQKSKRVDKCIKIFEELLLSKQFDELTKIHKGKNATELAELKERHESGTMLSVWQSSDVSSPSWIIPSSTIDGLNYIMTIDNNHSCSDSGCVITCDACGACKIKYSCTCHDYQIRGSVCKHLHATAVATTKVTEPAGKITSYKVLEIVQVKVMENNLGNQQKNLEIIRKVNELTGCLTACEKEIPPHVQEQVLGHIKAAVQLLKPPTPTPTTTENKPISSSTLSEQNKKTYTRKPKRCNIFLRKRK